MIKNIPKRHFYNNKDYKLDFEKKKMILSPNFHEKLLNHDLWGKFGFKKIGGSIVGDVLEVDKFKSSFSAFCKIAWCGLPVLDTKYIDAGVAIEPMVISAIEEKLKIKIKTFPPHEYDFDYFKGKDDIIGGIPDGFIESEKIIIEIKTTGIKNYENWKLFGVPVGYEKQAQLYAHLMGVEKFWIVATFLEEYDYNQPELYPIHERKIKNFAFKVNQEQVKDDIDKMKEWYIKHTKSGISPTWNEQIDNDLIEYLKCENENQYIELLEKWKEEGKFIDK